MQNWTTITTSVKSTQ